MSRPFFRQNTLSVVQQYFLLKRDYPDGTGTLRNDRLVWRHWLQPTPLSRRYRLRLIFILRNSPVTIIEEPCLSELAAGRRIPHLYEEKPARLCLYQPAYEEWSSAKRLSETIVPWATLWLFYFEDWMSSNEWRGGGEHPQRNCGLGCN